VTRLALRAAGLVAAGERGDASGSIYFGNSVAEEGAASCRIATIPRRSTVETDI